MKKVSGAAMRPSLLMCFYGMAKMWKSTTALMIPPEMRPVAYLDADNGAAMRLALLAMTPEQRTAMKVTEVLPEGSGPWVREGIDFYYPDPTKSYYQQVWEFTNNIVPDYKTVIYDTMSRIGDSIMKEIIHTDYENVKNPSKMRMKLTSGNVTTTHAAISDYGFAQDRMMEIITAADKTNAHVILVSHEKAGEVKEGDTTKRTVGGPRSIGNALLEVIPSVVDIALHFQPQYVASTQGTKIVVRSRNHGFFQAGDRSGIFPDGADLDPVQLWQQTLDFIKLGEASKPAAVAGSK